MKSHNRNWIYYFFLSLLVFIVFQLKFGLSILLPSNDAWLYGWTSDMLPDICTWQYYRYSPLWHEPFGVFTGYGYPQVTGIGNTNIVPLFGMPLKLFNQWLPEHFQYFGIFLFTCYILHAWFADRLLINWGVYSYIWRFCGVLFVLIAAPFLDRYCHIALCAHWIILAGLCVYWSPNYSRSKRVWGYAGLGFVAVMTHPYLVLFPLMLASATDLKYWQRDMKRWKYVPFSVVACIFSIAIGGYLSGIFSLNISGSTAGGFGIYSSNVNTFWNNLGKTHFTPLDLHSFGPGQFEGYAYLGVGVLILWLSLLLQKPFFKMLRSAIIEHWSLFLLLFLASIFAFAFRITLGEQLVFDPELGERTFLYRAASVFRSSGRYIWLPFYMLLLLPIVYYGRKPAQRKLLILLSVAVCLQVADISKALARCVSSDNYRVGPYWKSLVDVSRQATFVYTYPAFQRGLAVTDDIQYLTGALGAQQIPITAGHLPRPDIVAQSKTMDTLQLMSDSGQWLLHDNAILITIPEEIAYFASLQELNSIDIRAVGPYRIIYKKGNNRMDSFALQRSYPFAHINVIGLADFLEQQDCSYMILVSKDEASGALKPEMRQALSTNNPILSRLQWGEPYAAIYAQGRLLKEVKLTRGKDLEWNYKLPIADGRIVQIALRATSGNQQEPNLRINNMGMHHFKRGLNIFLFDKNMELISQKYIDLYKTYYMNQ